MNDKNKELGKASFVPANAVATEQNDVPTNDLHQKVFKALTNNENNPEEEEITSLKHNVPAVSDAMDTPDFKAILKSPRPDQYVVNNNDNNQQQPTKIVPLDLEDNQEVLPIPPQFLRKEYSLYYINDDFQFTDEILKNLKKENCCLLVEFFRTPDLRLLFCIDPIYGVPKNIELSHLNTNITLETKMLKIFKLDEAIRLQGFFKNCMTKETFKQQLDILGNGCYVVTDFCAKNISFQNMFDGVSMWKCELPQGIDSNTKLFALSTTMLVKIQKLKLQQRDKFFARTVTINGKTYKIPETLYRHFKPKNMVMCNNYYASGVIDNIALLDSRNGAEQRIIAEAFDKLDPDLKKTFILSRYSENTNVLYKVTFPYSNFEEANSSYNHFTSVLVYKRFVYRLLDAMNGFEYYHAKCHEIIRKAMFSDSFIISQRQISEILQKVDILFTNVFVLILFYEENGLDPPEDYAKPYNTISDLLRETATYKGTICNKNSPTPKHAVPSVKSAPVPSSTVTPATNTVLPVQPPAVKSTTTRTLINKSSLLPEDLSTKKSLSPTTISKSDEAKKLPTVIAPPIAQSVAPVIDTDKLTKEIVASVSKNMKSTLKKQNKVIRHSLARIANEVRSINKRLIRVEETSNELKNRMTTSENALNLLNARTDKIHDKTYGLVIEMKDLKQISNKLMKKKKKKELKQKGKVSKNT